MYQKSSQKQGISLVNVNIACIWAKIFGISRPCYNGALLQGELEDLVERNANLPQENVHINAWDDDKNVTCMNKKMTKGGLTHAWKHVTIALDTFYMHCAGHKHTRVKWWGQTERIEKLTIGRLVCAWNCENANKQVFLCKGFICNYTDHQHIRFKWWGQ